MDARQKTGYLALGGVVLAIGLLFWRLQPRRDPYPTGAEFYPIKQQLLCDHPPMALRAD